METGKKLLPFRPPRENRYQTGAILQINDLTSPLLLDQKSKQTPPAGAILRSVTSLKRMSPPFSTDVYHLHKSAQMNALYCLPSGKHSSLSKHQAMPNSESTEPKETQQSIQHLF